VSNHRARRTLAAIAVTATLLGVDLAHGEDAPATGSVRGSVELLRRKAFGGLGPSDDHSGVVIYVTGFQREAPHEVALLAQRDSKFVPRVLPIVRGQTVRFPNEDGIYHNVFSVSPLASFDLGQYKGTDPPRSIEFERTGLVPVFCNIHPQMLSYVAVLENDAYAVTTPDGRFAIEGLPADAPLTLNAWIPGAQRVSEPLRVAPGEARELALRVEQSERIGPHRRKDGSVYPPKRGSGYDGK
jgi:plastocyanin